MVIFQCATQQLVRTHEYWNKCCHRSLRFCSQRQLSLSRRRRDFKGLLGGLLTIHLLPKHEAENRCFWRRYCKLWKIDSNGVAGAEEP